MDLTDSLRASNIAIVTHVFADGPSQALEQFLKPKANMLVFIGHPFSYAPQTNSFYRKYVGGVLLQERTAPSLRLPDPILYVKDVIYTFLWLIFSKGRFDLYVGVDNLNAFVGLILKKFGKVRRVVFYTIDYVPKRFDNKILNAIYHWVDRFCVYRADQTWNLSPRMTDGRQKRGIDLDKTRQVVIPMGAYYKRTRRIPLEQANTNEIAFVGHLLEKQGVQLVLQALVYVKERIPNVKLVIIGTGPYESVLKNLAKDLGLENNVEFVGFVANHEGIEERLAKCAMAVAPYNSRVDTFTYYADPGKLKVYLAAGLPIVLTDVPHLASLIQDQRCGMVVNYDTQELAQAIYQLLNDEQLLREFRNNAAVLGKEYDWDCIFTRALEGVLS